MVELKENEWLLKVDKEFEVEAEDFNCIGKGFMTKLNKDGSIPVNFLEWNQDVGYEVHKEDYSYGWKLVSFRSGKSQNWVILQHPKGFTVEVRAYPFITCTLRNIDIVRGEIMQRCKWNDKILDVWEI